MTFTTRPARSSPRAAALSGRSLQEHLRAQLVQLASSPDAETRVARVREHKVRTGGAISAERIPERRDADRVTVVLDSSIVVPPG